MIHPVVWIEPRLIFDTNCSTLNLSNYKHHVLAICGYSRRIFRIEPLTSPVPLLLSRIRIKIDRISDHPKLYHHCSEAYCCLDFTCKLNQTTEQTYLDYYPDLEPEDLPKDFGQVPVAFNRDQDGKLHDFSDIIKDKKAGAILTNLHN